MKALSFTEKLRLPRAAAPPAIAAAGTPPYPEGGGIQKTLYGFILRHSWRQQLQVLALTLVSFPFLYYSLDLPKNIINVITKWRPHDFSVGFAEFHLNHLQYLWTLCGLYFAMVIVNGAFKYWINRYKGQLGERMLRRLRFELFKRLLRFPVAHFKEVSPGQLIPMITSEVEPLGGFIGDAFALPAFQGGTLLTIVFFMFMQDWILGLASVSLYPIQGYVIPKLQRKVNQLGKARVRTMRRVADRVSETTYGVQDIHAQDNARFQLANFTQLLGTIYEIRFEIYQRKFFVKFLNNTLNAVTPFFFFAIGGYLVIEGNLSAGALVAVIAAYKDLSSPWKELLDYYQSFQDTRIKYDQVVEQFQPEGMLDERLIMEEPAEIPHFHQEISLATVTLLEDGRVRVVDGVTANIPLNRAVAMVGQSNSGKHELALLMARLVLPTSGRIMIDGSDLAGLSTAVLGTRIGYAGSVPYLFGQSLGENLVASLKHHPVLERQYEGPRARKRQFQVREARLSGNLDYDIEADWIDYKAAGVADRASLGERLMEVLRLVDLDQDVYLFGLRGRIDPETHADAAGAMLEARKALRRRLESDKLTNLVEPFDVNRYNSNASVAENLLFGTPVGPAFELNALADNTYVQQVLEKAGLADGLTQVGLKAAETMVEIFSDSAPSPEFIEQFSFIGSDELPEFKAILARVAASGAGTLRKEERRQLLAVAFKLVVSKHRLGVIDEALQARILEARRLFAAGLPASLKSSIAFFADDAYNAAASLQDNILFGKIAHGEADAEQRLNAVLSEVIDALGLRRTVVEAGLEYQVGPGGTRLSLAQRQKVALARAVLKRPDLIVLDEATSALDAGAQSKMIAGLKAEFGGRGLVWALHRASLAKQFDEVVVLSNGRVVEQGSLTELDKPGTHFTLLTMAE